MGKASSSKKVQRAAKASGRPGAKKNYGWPLTIGAIVLLGVMLIVVTVSTNDDTEAGPPRVGDHWHAAFGVYDCDSFLPPLPDSMASGGDLHTHADGLMHIEPAGTRFTGAGANLGAFAAPANLTLTDRSFAAGGVQRTNGDMCGSERGRVQLVTWDSPSDETPTVIRKNIADYAPQDGSVWALAFVADGADVPLPNSVSALANPTGNPPVPPGSSTTAVPADNESSTTSAPAEESRSTSTPAP